MNPHLLDHSITRWFFELPQGSSIQAEYVWIGGSGLDMRCKTRTLDKVPAKAEELPEWNYDGSSTGQAPGHDSEVILKPRAIFRDPFRRGNNILVMCDTWTPQGEPLPTNTRAPAAAIFDKCADQKCWYGIEQEFTLHFKDGRPFGFPRDGYPAPQGPYYCSAGANEAFGRDVIESHYRACLYAGVKIAGINAEVFPGQWEFQVGPCEGIDIGDHMWMARYILTRIAEMFQLCVSFDPKPISGDWNGSGAHTNFSTLKMREPNGYSEIISAIKKLEKKHHEHISIYGKDNHKRLTGRHETQSIDKFSYGVADRGASIRIPRTTEAQKCGYFEDRRPAANCDPYTVASKIADTVCVSK